MSIVVDEHLTCDKCKKTYLWVAKGLCDACGKIFRRCDGCGGRRGVGRSLRAHCTTHDRVRAEAYRTKYEDCDGAACGKCEACTDAQDSDKEPRPAFYYVAAREAVDKIIAEEGTDVPGAVRDLLTELLHFCEASGINFDERLALAREVVTEEKQLHTDGGR